MQSSGAFYALLLRWRHRQMGLAAEQQNGTHPPTPDLPARRTTLKFASIKCRLCDTHCTDGGQPTNVSLTLEGQTHVTMDATGQYNEFAKPVKLTVCSVYGYSTLHLLEYTQTQRNAVTLKLLLELDVLFIVL